MMRWIAALWWGFWATLAVLFEDHKLARRMMLFWVIWICSVVVLRATRPEVLVQLGGTAAGIIVTGVLGLLGTVITFYLKSREREDARRDKP